MAKALAIVAEVEAAPGSALATELDELTGHSIAVVRDVLTRRVAKKAYTVTVNGKQKRVEPDMRLLGMQAQVATDIIKAKIRVDETAFRAHQTSRLLPLMEALLAGEEEAAEPGST